MADNSNPSDPIKPDLNPEEPPESGDEKPQVFAVNREDKEHKFNRRGFLELAGAATAGLILSTANSAAAEGGTSTRTPTRTPTPMPCTIRTSQKGVKVHVGPGRNRGVLLFLPANQEFRVIGQAKAGDGSAWWKIEMKDVPQAWVAQKDVESAGDCEEVGGAKIPPVVVAATRAPTGVPIPPGQPGTVPPGQTGINYSSGGQTFTLPCGSPIPAGATCICNCVSVPAPCSCDGVCSCAGACSCDGASHYWYPN